MSKNKNKTKASINDEMIINKNSNVIENYTLPPLELLNDFENKTRSS